MTRGNIITTIHNQGGPRIRFSCPEEGYAVDGTGALDASALGALESGAALASTSLCTSFSF